MSQSSNNRGVKKLSPGKYLFFLNTKDIYYMTFENIDLTNIEIILIKLCPKETYVYKNIIPFQNLGTNDFSPQDTLRNIDFIIYNFDFTISEEYNKFIFTIKNTNTKSETNIDLFLFNKNMEKNNMKKFLEKKNIIDGLQNKIHELISITSNQKKQINYLKEKEQKQHDLINKIDEVTNKISSQYKNKINNNINQQNNINNNNNNNNFNNIKNNFNIPNQTDKKLLRTVVPQCFKNNMDMDFSNKNNLNNNNNMNSNMNTKKKLNVTVNVKYSPYLPNNANMDNLLTRPQNMYPNQPQQNMPKPRNINLDNIPDYRYK